MSVSLAPVSRAVPAAVPATGATAAKPAAAPSALKAKDHMDFTHSKAVKAQFGPAISLVEQAGYAKTADKLRNAHYILTDGKSFNGVEYYAAAMPGGLVFIDRKALKDLSTKEWASTLLHEGTHLQQNAAMKLVWGWESMLTKKPDEAEKRAYIIQWGAMDKLDLHDGEIYWAVKEQLHDMGIKTDK